MHRLTIAGLVNEIDRLGTENSYAYVSGRTTLQITHIKFPEGPIQFVRTKDQESNKGTVSTQQLARLADVCSAKPNYPIHIDRLFSAGGNSRSALETMLAYTPHFFICYPKRIDSYTGETLQNLKHIMWCPEIEHPLGTIQERGYHELITEMELGVDFGVIGITPAMLGEDFETIEAKTIHTQMQVALVEIGNALNFKTWIARNDHGIRVGTNTLGTLPGTIPTLENMKILWNAESRDTAMLIDCIWFTQDNKRIPAIIEIEHSTGVTSGLTRMLKWHHAAPSTSTTFTIVAPNHLRNKVITEANQPIFRELNARFMPYSTVRELYGLIKRYTLTGIVDHKFIDPFMENIVS